MTTLSLETASVQQVNENLTIYSLIPPEAGLGCKLELFKLAQPIVPHYHKVQRQFILVTEGNLNAFCGNEAPLALRKGDLVCIDPGMVHSLVPEETAYFFAIDFPGFHFPEDVFYDKSHVISPWTPPNNKSLSMLDPKYFGVKIDLGDYFVYELVTGSMTQEQLSVALLEIQNSPRHFHRIEKELFVVVSGELDIEVEGEHQILRMGEYVIVPPNRVHHLKSCGKEAVQVLCFSFPAFNPTDMYCL